MKRSREINGTPWVSEDLFAEAAEAADGVSEEEQDEPEAHDWSVEGGALSTLEAAVEACRDV
eukprot:3072267-Prymnesium_polylepis.1